MENSSCVNYTELQLPVGPMQLLHVGFQAAVMAFGLAGNGILIFIIATNRSQRSIPNLFIVNLAAADCVYLCVFIPCDIASKFGAHPSPIFCKILYFCRVLTVGVSVYTLLAMSADRCLAILRPLSGLKSSCPNLAAKLGLLGIWILAGALAAPYAAGAHLKENRHRGACVLVRSCYPFPESWGLGYRNGMLISKLLLYYVTPGGLICVFYSLMAARLLRTVRNNERRTSSSGSAQDEGRRKLAKLVLCLALVFFVAWGPEYVAMVYFFFVARRVGSGYVLLKMVAKALPSAYSASNPVTLCIISQRFRGLFLQTIGCGRCGQRPPASASRGPPAPSAGHRITMATRMPLLQADSEPSGRHGNAETYA